MRNSGTEHNNTCNHIVAKLSHELRTPLAIIHSNLQFLEDDQVNMDKEIKAEAFNLSFLAMRNIIQLLDNVSILEKTNSGLLEARISRVNIREIVEIIVNELHAIKEYKCRIIVRNDLDEEEVKIDSFLLQHILSNVIINSLKYSDRESIVKVTLQQDDFFIFFIIKDYGIGIPEEDLEKIYEKFYRGINASNIKGSGIGLNIVQRCLLMMGGNIEIDSAINEGTTAKIAIPYEN